jgi:HrpA-like RNA helicase
MNKIGIYRKGTYSPAYSNDDQKIEISNATADMRGIDALIYTLQKKKILQENTVDKHIFGLRAETGTGKSTAMVVELYKKYIKSKIQNVSIICTQPRIVLAQNNAMNVSYFTKELKLGENVGYITGGGSIIPTSKQSIVYMTTQTLYNMIYKNNPMTFGKRYPIIIIDEAHEMSIEMLVTLNILKNFINIHYKEYWCPLVIITSATIFPPEFVDYFGANPLSSLNTCQILGTTNFKIIEHYIDNGQKTIDNDEKTIDNDEKTIEKLNNNEQKTVDLASDLIIDIVKKSNDDILCIVKGPSDIERVIGAITGKFDGLKYFFANEVSEITSPPVDDKKWISIASLTKIDVIENNHNIKLTRRNKLENEIRIYVSTPVSEIGITFPTLGHIIDSGWRFMPISYPLYRQNSLVQVPISYLNHIQRRGRVGRTKPGDYWALFTEDVKNRMMKTEYPSTILSDSYTMEILKMIMNLTLEKYNIFGRSIEDMGKLLALNSIENVFNTFDFINDNTLLYKYTFDANCIAFRELYKARLITKYGQLTPVGYQLANIKGQNTLESISRIILTHELIHPFDIEIICLIMRPGFMSSNIFRPFDDDKIKDIFYMKKLKVVSPVADLFKVSQDTIMLLSKDEWDPTPNINIGEILKLLNRAFGVYNLYSYYPTYIESTDSEKNRVIGVIKWLVSKLMFVEREIDVSSHYLS